MSFLDKICENLTRPTDVSCSKLQIKRIMRNEEADNGVVAKKNLKIIILKDLIQIIANFVIIFQNRENMPKY
jgi:hypothetical protein